MLPHTLDHGCATVQILEEDQHKCFVKTGLSGFINGQTEFKVCLTMLKVGQSGSIFQHDWSICSQNSSNWCQKGSNWAQSSSGISQTKES